MRPYYYFEMQCEQDELYPEALCPDGSFQKTSLNTTEIHSALSHTLTLHKLRSQDTQPTLPDLPPFSSRALDFEDPEAPSPLELQLTHLLLRFTPLHRKLIAHAELESDLHERKRGFKVLPIDRGQQTADYGNKTSIAGDIVSLVEDLEGGTEELTEILDSKFQQYYLQRHYGGLSCDFGNLSIQDRLDCEYPPDEEEPEPKPSEHSSHKMGDYVSLIHESKITYTEEFCQTHPPPCDLPVDVPRIIEVEIPILVYKFKEVVIKYEESDLRFNNIDDIIDKYSRNYDQLYSQSRRNSRDSGERETPADVTVQNDMQTPAQSNIVASIMLNSNHHMLPKETEIELCYSEMPEETNNGFKLPLDSYAQLGSLISHESNSNTDRNSRPPTDRDLPYNEETIIITEKYLSKSMIEKFEENERILHEENNELKEMVEGLNVKVEELEKKRGELEGLNRKLANRLEEEIQQCEYFATKLDEIDAEVLEEKVQCLTHLNKSKDSKIDRLTLELEAKNGQIQHLQKTLFELDCIAHQNEQNLAKKEEEMHNLTDLLHQKEQELVELNKAEENVIKIASQTEISLKQQIEKLQQEKLDLKDHIKEYQSRLQAEGMSLQYEQAAQIQGIIESREHTHSLELQQVNKKYQEIIQLYQGELSQLKVDLNQLALLNQTRTKELANKTKTQLMTKAKNETFFKEFEDIIREYDRELEAKDEELLALRMQKGDASQAINSILERSSRTIDMLEKQLARERTDKLGLTAKLVELDTLIRKEIATQKQRKEIESEAKLIESLTEELQKKLSENNLLKCKIDEQSTLITNLLTPTPTPAASHPIQPVLTALKTENQKLRKVNTKLKRYTISLEQQIRAVCGVDECQSHQNWINQVIDQRNYYLGLATDPPVY